MIINLYIVCDRCSQIVPDAAKSCDGTTCGYYEVAGGTWHRFSNAGEKYLCDACMFSDPRYQAVYGIMKGTKEEG